MARKIRVSRGKRMKPNFFVFCEGKTEIAYVKFLRDHKTKILTEKCIQKLQKDSKEYKKGSLSDEEKRCFALNVQLAIDRAKKMTEFENPSTTVYKLIEILQNYIEDFE